MNNPCSRSINRLVMSVHTCEVCLPAPAVCHYMYTAFLFCATGYQTDMKWYRLGLIIPITSATRAKATKIPK